MPGGSCCRRARRWPFGVEVDRLKTRGRWGRPPGCPDSRRALASRVSIESTSIARCWVHAGVLVAPHRRTRGQLEEGEHVAHAGVHEDVHVGSGSPVEGTASSAIDSTSFMPRCFSYQRAVSSASLAAVGDVMDLLHDRGHCGLPRPWFSAEAPLRHFGKITEHSGPGIIIAAILLAARRLQHGHHRPARVTISPLRPPCASDAHRLAAPRCRRCGLASSRIRRALTISPARR